MKFDINNPAFLQSAGSVSAASSIVVRYAEPEFTIEINRGTGGTVVVTKTVDGATNTQSIEIDSSGEVFIAADQGTNVTITGDITSLTDATVEGYYIGLEYLDISKCRSMTLLSLGDDLRELGEIKMRATSLDVATGIASAIRDSGADGVVYLKQGDEYNNTVLTAAQNSGWEVRYF